MHQYHEYGGETLYIAGPECFYTNGYERWDALGKEAEYYGFQVVMPTKNELKLGHEDPRRDADTIFANCALAIGETTALIANLETFRGAEPDGGSIFEMGMAWARGARCYAYTRDKRDMVQKYQGVALRDGRVNDLTNRVLPYQDLPFSPCVTSVCRIVEGGYSDALKLLMTDLDEERKHGEKRAYGPAERLPAPAKRARPVAYLAGPERYTEDAAERYARMKELCAQYGFDAVTPLDGAPETAPNDPLQRAYGEFERWMRHVRECDVIFGDLNDFHGWEPNSDVSFECGAAWQLGKRCFGYMADTSVMRDRIPHYGSERGHKDLYGSVVENFDYPINLMFASSMSILKGDLEQALAAAADTMKGID